MPGGATSVPHRSTTHMRLPCHALDFSATARLIPTMLAPAPAAHANCRDLAGGTERSTPSVAPMNPPALFHPAVAAWFADRFAAPTPAQAQAWPAIQAGRHTLIAAPTGSGKTLAAFLAAIDGLVRQGLDGRPRRRHAGGLRLAAEGAVQRHPAQPGGAARRHPRRRCASAACPTSTSAPGCAPATRRQASATACAAARRISS